MRLSPRIPDLPALDLLLSIVELGSLGRAARAHGISQPAASSRIRSLERLIGTSVLERTPSGSRPTDSGTFMVGWAREVVEAAQRLDAGIAHLLGERDARLRVAASQTVAEYLFPGWLTDLRARVPQTAITLEVANSAQVGETVLAGRAGIGFIESPRPCHGLESGAVTRDRLLVVVSPRHPWARRSAIEPRELARTPVIQREQGSGTRMSFERALAAHVTEGRAEPVLELSSTTAIKHAAAGDIGPAVLSSLAVAAELAAGTLVTVDVLGFEAWRTLRAIWPTGQRPAGPARDLYAIAYAARAQDAARTRPGS
ncbi:LysR family transcriptional regulator [Streptomyces sp. NPDC047123]|uniref:LysR family transcriptional regulator n=1 Tax=Streptomyces sp. NPDC047123 TaxID=3155622 RepID=UPI0033C845BF